MVPGACTCRSERDVVQDAATVVDEASVLLRPHFHRAEAHRHAADYLRGLISEVERKNGWQLAEHAGYAHPRGMQRVLDRYAWDADAVRDDLRRYVITELGDAQGILVVDETSFPKQGRHSAGVARQYAGTLGKIANCPVGVFLGYASPRGHVALDRELFIPEHWFADPSRCQQVGIPKDRGPRTKPALALAMLERALDHGVPAAWVTGDEVYGSDGKLRQRLEARPQGYVLAVRANQSTTTWPPYAQPGQTTVSAATAHVPAAAWQRLSCGVGAQGPRLYDWAWVPLRPALMADWTHGVLVRRHLEHADDLAYYLTYTPLGTPLAELARVAGARWTIDDLFKLAKGQVGLDHYEVRSWHGWYRHITLALLALTVLTIGARQKGDLPARSISPSPSPNFAASSSVSSGRRCVPPTNSSSGPVGADPISASPNSVTTVAA